MRFFLGEAEPNRDQYKIIFAIFRFDDRRRLSHNFPERCKELGITYVAGGACQLQHNHFMFVETDDMDKLRDLMLPMMGIWDITVTPVKERA